MSTMITQGARTRRAPSGGRWSISAEPGDGIAITDPKGRRMHLTEMPGRLETSPGHGIDLTPEMARCLARALAGWADRAEGRVR